MHIALQKASDLIVRRLFTQKQKWSKRITDHKKGLRRKGLLVTVLGKITAFRQHPDFYDGERLRQFLD